MRLELDFGFSSFFVLVACAVFPVISLVVRSKWRRSVARKEEIRRLIVLASQEAARAEIEASAGYGAFQAHVFDDGYCDTLKASQLAQTGENFCAVCYVPTTRRCAQCKAVRYCSNECQFTHWRLGHKDECHPLVKKSGFGDRKVQHSNHEHGIRDRSKFVDKKKLLYKSANLSPDDSPSPSIDSVNKSATSVGKSKGCQLDLKASSRQDDGVTTREVSSESAGISANVGRYGNKELFTYELFVKLYTWKEVELRPCGLINCGNSCYANAVLQCMAFTPPLTALFSSRPSLQKVVQIRIGV